jgi:hypothetical protein
MKFSRRMLLCTALGFSLCLAPGGETLWQHRPGSDAQVRELTPEISVILPLGASLPYRDARVFVDGQDVSADCVKTALLITYRPSRPLVRGHHKVEVQIGEQRQNWAFEVVGQPLITGCIFSAPPVVKPFDRVDVEARGEVRGKAWAELVGFPEKYELKEKLRGHYRGNFKVPAKLHGRETQVEVFLQKDGALDRQICPGKLAVAAPHLTVQWVTPADGAVVEPRFRAIGKTLPGTPVTIKARLFFRDGVEFGKLPQETVQQVKADRDGRFAYEFSFPPGLPRLGVRLRAQVEDSTASKTPESDVVLFQGRTSGAPLLQHELPPAPGP